MKRLIQTIYGMQYEELVQNDKDGNKARINGNLFLTGYVIVFLFLIILAAMHIPECNDTMNRFLSRTFGRVSSGKVIGRLITIPLLVLIYFIVSKTIGSEFSFQKHVKTYSRYSEEAKKKSFKIVMISFLTMLGLMLALALT